MSADLGQREELVKSGDSDQSDAPAPQPRKGGIRPGVFWPSIAIIIGFALIAIIGGDSVSGVIGELQSGIVSTFGWYYIVLVTGFVIFALWVGLSHFGDIVLGPEEGKPEFTMGSWLAMLFAAGMGIGLMFWGVAEPLHHFAGIPNRASGVAAADAAGGEQALVVTFLHWGLHPWAIYVVVGLALAYAVHVRNRPVSIRWSLEALLGKRTDGWIGNVIDVTAIVGTVFGVATSLGFGVSQVAGGLQFMDIIAEPSNMVLVILIGLITGLALVSVLTGVKKGIKFLSNANMGIGIALMVFVLVAGPTLFLMREYIEATGSYLQQLLQLAFSTSATSGEDGVVWQGWWTAFYWGWWISWAPFVGVFIARISRGRTVREFVMGVLLLPTAFSFLWFTIFGGAALYQELTGSGGLVTQGEDGPVVDATNALFTLLDSFPGGSLLVGVAILLVVLFFVTSSDSGSLVVDMLASGGDLDPPKWSRVLWALLEGLVAVALVLAGGLSALRGVAIAIALPFSVVMIFMCIALLRQFRKHRARTLSAQRRLVRDELTEHVSTTLTDQGRLPAAQPAGAPPSDPKAGSSPD
ncbi:MAG: BCCT family transporter [Beutenbergiaceae bacterium]